MANTFTSTKTNESASAEALENKEGDVIKPSIDTVAGDSAKKAGERMKKNEEGQIFSK